MSSGAPPKVLLVDDDVMILSSFKRSLRKRFKMDLVTSGEEALQKAAENTYAVIVSDLQMPGMNGITLLEKLKDLYPQTVTMMLTGNADIRLAIAAVNQGHVFRFYTKPCEPDALGDGIEAAMNQYKLVQAERILLDQTLKGAVQSLTQVLSLASPESFSRASRMERLVRELVARNGLQEHWEFEVAASLSQLGCVTLPERVLRSVASGESLTSAEERAYQEHPKQAVLLMSNIPRLESVQLMIEKQMDPYLTGATLRLEKNNFSEEEKVLCGSQMLKVTHDYDLALGRGHCSKEALKKMNEDHHQYHPLLLEQLGDIVYQERRVKKQIKVSQLRAGMVIEEDLMGRNNRLIVKKGQEITPLIERFIEKVEFMGGLETQILMVSVPEEVSENAA